MQSHTPGDFSVHSFLQLAIILVACRLVGWLGACLLGRPQVVGRIAAAAAIGLPAMTARRRGRHSDQALRDIHRYSGLLAPGIVMIFNPGSSRRKASGAAVLAALASPALSLLPRLTAPQPFMGRILLALLLVLALAGAVSPARPRPLPTGRIVIANVDPRTARGSTVAAPGVATIPLAPYAESW